jgi:hypothetical protein
LNRLTLSEQVEKNPVAAIGVEETGDTKLGKVSALHVSQYGCDVGCPFYPKVMPELGAVWNAKTDFTCYANHGTELFTAIRMNSSFKRGTAIARDAVRAILGLTGRRHLRLGVVGDFSTLRGVRMVARASEQYMARFGKRAWGYTHSWAKIPRRFWGSVNIRASVHTEAEVREARARGYTLALAYTTKDGCSLTRPFQFGGEKFTPCPHQWGAVTDCLHCGLCFKTDVNIGFVGHNSAADGHTNGAPLVLIEG